VIKKSHSNGGQRTNVRTAGVRQPYNNEWTICVQRVKSK